jgi:hypothetical protein
MFTASAADPVTKMIRPSIRIGGAPNTLDASKLIRASARLPHMMAPFLTASSPAASRRAGEIDAFADTNLGRERGVQEVVEKIRDEHLKQVRHAPRMKGFRSVR